MREILTHLTPLKAIRLKCLECAGSFKAIKNCTSAECSLYIYRLGHNPQRKGIGVRDNLFRLKGRHSSGQVFTKSGILNDHLNIILQEK